ncbi:MAG TPA: PASTA domain-containing protein, partial [Acidimicrobiales bacterium]|nr:PASTA domain-containing protein [Acidimicrobiales bacterium]
MAGLATSLVLLAPSTVGAATKHAPVRMPNLIGHSRVQVYRIMRADGLYFLTRGPGSANDRWAAVTTQSPRPGVVIAWHAEAVLTVTTQSPRGPRAVPRLAGLTKAGVFAAMRRAQLYFTTVGPGSTSNTWTVALGQNPAPGTRVRWHDEITVRVSTHRPVAAVKKRTPVKATAVVINGTGFKIGVATWYNYVPGRCATWYLPKGTTITVTDLVTGKSVTCVITDREGQGANRVVDLNETQFAQLAPLSQGVISVKVSW